MSRRNRKTAAFTLPEMLIASAALVIVLGGVLTSHLFAARLFQITKAKLGAGQDARIAISKLGDEIRTAKWIQVGAGNASTFTEAEDGQAQQGNAIQIYQTATNTPYIRYFLDTNSTTLRRLPSGTGQAVDVIATSITNKIIFTSENSQGTVLTNSENNRVIGLTLSFYQIQYPIIRIGPGEFYDYYQLRTRITRRALE